MTEANMNGKEMVPLRRKRFEELPPEGKERVLAIYFEAGEALLSAFKRIDEALGMPLHDEIYRTALSVALAFADFAVAMAHSCTVGGDMFFLTSFMEGMGALLNPRYEDLLWSGASRIQREWSRRRKLEEVRKP